MQRGPESFSSSVKDTHGGAKMFRAKGPGTLPKKV
jgi:hypothetical protein